jgi:hypothetical protein
MGERESILMSCVSRIERVSPAFFPGVLKRDQKVMLRTAPVAAIQQGPGVNVSKRKLKRGVVGKDSVER